MHAFRHTLRFALVALLFSFLSLPGAFVTDAEGAETFAATHTRNGLAFTMPYHAEHAGQGKLVVEVLDPDDQVLGRSEHDTGVAAGDGVWHQEITFTKPLPYDEAVWERVRYRFTYNDGAAPLEETRAVSEILRRPVVRILGQTTYLTGGEAAIRVIVTDASGHEIAGNNTLRVELVAGDHGTHTLFTGKLNRHGTTEAQFHFPAGLTGNVQLRFVADTPLGVTESMQAVRLEDKVSILLTTEKPIYQPGQTIHARALALDRADHHAAPGKLTFEVEDSRGNKVFKKATETDAFGIASAGFTLADEVNLGTYHLRALMGDPQSPTNTAEVALNVQRYVLPKFKVAVDFTAKDGKPRRDYRPGEHVTGTVHANYFFGKPVDGGEITVKATGMDVTLNDVGSAKGKTDKDGSYHFDIKLPTYFAGRPLKGGAAPVVVEAAVKDSSGHEESRGEPVTVSASALLVTAIPEGGTLIPNLENQVYVLVSYADGSPAAAANITAKVGGLPDQHATADKSGVAVVRYTPSAAHEALRVEASDTHGNRTDNTVSLETRDGNDQVLLRADRAVYKAGDRIELNVFSTQQRGTAYIDIVKDGQTVMTRDVDIVNGRAELAVTATPDMAGTLDVNVYRFGRDAQAIGDHRLLFVQPAEELRIEATADAPAYKPGAEARIHFRVTDGHGQGVRAALGLQIVDEAVFALAEKQPGFAKVFFYLEQEAMKPRYEIHSLVMDDVVDVEEREHDLDARALFAATEIVSPNKLDTEFGRELPQAKFQDYQQRYASRFQEQVSDLTAKMNEEIQKHPGKQDLSERFVALRNGNGTQMTDSWGTPFRLHEATYWRNSGAQYFMLSSAGPDRKFNTGDDLQQMIEARTGTVSGGDTGRPLTMRIEHDRGPNNGMAGIVGTVTDPTGAPIPQAEVTVRSADGRHFKAVSHANGSFEFSAVSAGSYVVSITAPGFMRSEVRMSLQARDRGVVNGALSVGAVSETVVVNQEAVATLAVAPMQRRAFAPAKAMAGMAGMEMTDAAVMAPPPPASSASLNGDLRSAQPAAETHVRSYFPEALYINPEILTDGAGNATITVPIADSITTWRMAMLASTKTGALGTGTSSLKVFQDFFADLDLPVTLTQGDHVSIPVAIYNYAGERGDVKLTLRPEDWFSLVEDTNEKNVAVDAGQVGGSQYTLEARRIGKFKLTLTAHMHGKAERQDIVVREIEVVPNGREQNAVFNGRLDTPSLTSVKQTVQFPVNAIPEASKVFVRLYPGPLSQVIEGMDSLLRMPYGCFEQTSSSTYPNVLALDYMKRTKKLTPEVHAKAEGFIANGYQRLLTFEVPGGGFSWFGSAPANKILTAYGLMEFSDMSKVYDVDPNLIARTRDWLIAQQQPEGSWKPDTSFINEGATNRYNSDQLRITAYIAWALENTGYQGPALEKAKHFLETHMSGKVDSYSLAVLANFAVDYGKDREFTREAIQRLLDARVEKDEQTWWTSEETGVYATGTSAAVETTGLAVQALLKWGQSAGVARKAMTYIASKKDASGTWGTTQATIMALRALLLAAQIGSADVRGTAQVLLNGKTVETLVLTPDNNDLFHQFVLPGVMDTGANEVEIRFEGSGGLAYQVAGRYFLPWDTKPSEEDTLAIRVAYDRTKLEQNDIVTATATVRNNLPKTANMVMVDLGIPPGFELLTEDLQEFQEKTAKQKTGKLEKFSLTATQAILYFNAFAPRSTVELRFRLRAKFPIRARTFESKVYEYYDPAVSATAKPIQLEVAARK
ncbi:MAG TPA: MG2 domain-containing protein [Acidobacteriaceae bacterium]|jgi:uncharacterized protein YfaS (alpha-2-macroglobulin family)